MQEDTHLIGFLLNNRPRPLAQVLAQKLTVAHLQSTGPGCHTLHLAFTDAFIHALTQRECENYSGRGQEQHTKSSMPKTEGAMEQAAHLAKEADALAVLPRLVGQLRSGRQLPHQRLRQRAQREEHSLQLLLWLTKGTRHCCAEGAQQRP